MSSEADAIIGAVRSDIETAADALLAAAEKGLAEAAALRAGDAGALERLEGVLCAILEACAFQDLAGQRLSQLEAALSLGVTKTDSLLNGPAAAGAGLDQAAADALFAELPAPSDR